MYIPYDKIAQSIALFINPKYGKMINTIGENLKIASNCRYIEKNSKKVLKKLRKEIKHRKIRVAFYCFDKTKWKCQTLYDLFLNSENFEPFILVSINNCNKYAVGQMTSWNAYNTVNFFKEKNMNVSYAYYNDYNTNGVQYYPLKTFKPDIIFYQVPWYIPTVQGPVVTSKYALSYYVPYFVANVSSFMEYGLRFHLYLHKHYVLNDLIKNYYAPLMRNKGKNLVVTGHPQLDYFYLNKETYDKKYVIYAPHWSINYLPENYATFTWNGQHILDFAKSHPEIQWIFKPHPTLKSRLKSQNIMTTKEINAYWEEWEKIGLVHESGDYINLFSQSYAMITDCGSFLTEYFLTENPVIHLRSKNSAPYNPSAEKIVENYYKAYNIEELDNLLKMVILDKQDPMKETRIKAIEDLDFKNTYAAKNIFEDIKKELL